MDTQFKKERKATKKVLLLGFMGLPIFIIIIESHIHIGGVLQNVIKFKNIFPVKTCIQYSPTKSHEHNEKGHC